jgi:hypothetical protein
LTILGVLPQSSAAHSGSYSLRFYGGCPSTAGVPPFRGGNVTKVDEVLIEVVGDEGVGAVGCVQMRRDMVLCEWRGWLSTGCNPARQ